MQSIPDAAQTDQVADLVLFVEKYGDTFPSLRKRVLQLRDAHSVRVDLLLAQDMLQAVRTLGENDANDKISRDACLGLIQIVVVLYARALNEASNHRRKLQMLSKFTPAEKSTHIMMCALRSDAIAHFGPGRQIDQVWRDDGVFLVPNPDGSSIVASLSRNMAADRDLIDTLDQQVSRAVILSVAEVQRRNTRVVHALDSAMNGCPTFADLLTQSQVSLGHFLGSSEASASILSGPRFGTAKGGYAAKRVQV